MCCHCLGIAVPLGGVLGNCDDAGLHVMDIVSQMLMKSHGDGSVYFVFVHCLSPLS